MIIQWNTRLSDLCTLIHSSFLDNGIVFMLKYQLHCTTLIFNVKLGYLSVFLCTEHEHFLSPTISIGKLLFWFYVQLFCYLLSSQLWITCHNLSYIYHIWMSFWICEMTRFSVACNVFPSILKSRSSLKLSLLLCVVLHRPSVIFYKGQWYFPAIFLLFGNTVLIEICYVNKVVVSVCWLVYIYRSNCIPVMSHRLLPVYWTSCYHRTTTFLLPLFQQFDCMFTSGDLWRKVSW
jgi:hypothetical protein